ncbi:uncharacterized protein K460DRAFT_391238 [Cucurbitaria berberidis CBS 394.84]|uniref:Uncharacterized protein n=1 Tax=Cucurbitaria berberidis CBS 394.84 TaxID=1168544 RepID=A0A9P4GSQ8_9PLEO|nr:uncharacterized protein K460DRAFT_391238 [Cucurbitaria berberidis CBS 394.84]KAF1850829.1 hypothetical protein K460DRAFT_391238 [Cucurbitaria berberidis CBS 394.84]
MSTIIHTASGVVGNVGNQLQITTNRVGNQLQITTNRILPPQQREELLKKMRDFANQNPKLAAFLAAQIALTGLPLVLFLAFATTTLIVSVTTCILLGLLAALAFTFLLVGFALLFVVPTVFLASCSATFVFIWGFVGYIILRRLNEGEAPGKRGTRVGDKLQGLTGGRLALWIGDGEAEGGDDKAVEVGQIPIAKSQVRIDGGQGRDSASLQGNGGHANGVNDTHEWEDKWTNGARKDSEIGNPYEVLKEEELIHDTGTAV